MQSNIPEGHWPFHATTVGDIYAEELKKRMTSEADFYQIGGTHYQKAIQPWDAMEAWMTHDEFCGYLRGNVIKYVARYREKGGVEDLKKAKHYLVKLIETEDLK